MRPLRSAVLVSTLVAACGGDKDAGDAPAGDDDDTTFPTEPTDTQTEPSDSGTEPGPPPEGLSIHPDVSTVVLVSWEQAEDADLAWITWEVDGVPWSTPQQPRSAGPQTEVLLGTPAQTEVLPVLHWQSADGEQTTPLGTITTGRLPNALAVPTLVTADPSRHRPEPWLLTSVDSGPYDFFGPWWTVILDAVGRIVWYRETSESRMSWQVEAGDGYVTIDASNTYQGSVASFYRVPLDLREEEVITPPGFAQAFNELDDGTILYQETEGPYDFWLTRRDPDGSVDRLWACNPWMASFSTEFWACAANTITGHPSRGSAIYSMFITDTVVELDLETGAVLREFGRFPGGFSFDPPETTFRHQHLPTFTADGTLMTQTDDPTGQTQWAREYEIDDGTQTLRAIWSLRTDHFADYAGQVQPLPSGNVLWQHGTAGFVDELTRDGDVVWAVDWDGHLTGNVTPIADLYALNGGP